MSTAAGAEPALERARARLRQEGPAPPVWLVHGDLVLAEPVAERLAGDLAESIGCEVVMRRHPARLDRLFDDLKTLSLFEPGKVVLAVDTAVLADRRAAAGLIDGAAAVLPLDSEPGQGELAPREREAASRLLQALRLFDLDCDRGEPGDLLGELPKWALAGGASFRKGRRGQGRGKKQVEQLREELATLLAAAREAGLTGRGGSDLAELSALIGEGLPEGHALVLAESSAAADHPLVERLRGQGAYLDVGRLEEERGSFKGAELLARELERQTGVGIDRDALAELGRRTLRQGRGRQKKGRPSGVDADSTARFAAEYRKLANLVATEGAGIDRSLVERAVEDRGEEDVWKLLDAVGEGRGGEALERLARLLASAEDPLATRLSFFALFADFCRQLAAVRGMMQVAGVPPGEGHYPRFKSRWAPALTAELPEGAKNPLSGLHPYRLHRAYLAASRIPEAAAGELPAWVLETERRLKGDSRDPDTALAGLVARVADLTSRQRRG